MPKKKVELPADSQYFCHIWLTEDDVREAVSKMLVDKGYVVTDVDLQLTEDGIEACCHTRLPKTSIIPPKEVKDGD